MEHTATEFDITITMKHRNTIFIYQERDVIMVTKRSDPVLYEVLRSYVKSGNSSESSEIRGDKYD